MSRFQFRVHIDQQLMERRKKITGYVINLDRMLGEGSFGKVFVGNEDVTNDVVAIKILDKQKIHKNQYYKDLLFSEIEILKALKSPNIVGFLDVMESTNTYYIIQQYCNGGELRAYMDKVGKVPEKTAVGLLKQICNGFIELLREGVMHRDLKPQNILIHDGYLKIADFGLSKKGHDSWMTHQSAVGTRLYMSLQVMKSEPYSSKCDIWSLGCIFYEMLEQQPPWMSDTEYGFVKAIESTPLTFRSKMSSVTMDFIKRCLALEEKDRISWDEIYRHEIFEGCFTKNKVVSFENKFKTIMNYVRYLIKSQNMDIEGFFSKRGISQSNLIRYEVFEELFLSIDRQLEESEIRYIFNKIDIKRKGSFTYQEFSSILGKFGIIISKVKDNTLLHQPQLSPLKEHAKERVKPQTVKLQRVKPQRVKPSDSQTRVNKQQIAYKFRKCLQDLNKFLAQKNMDIYELIQSYKFSESGFMNINSFKKLLSIFDGSFTAEQVEICFKMVDKEGNSNIRVEDFVKFLKKTTSPPETMANNSITSDNSITLPMKEEDKHNLLHIMAQHANLTFGSQYIPQTAPEGTAIRRTDSREYPDSPLKRQQPPPQSRPQPQRGWFW